MASFTRLFDPTTVDRVEEVTITLPDPLRDQGDPLVRPGIARYAGATLVLLHVRPKRDSFALFSPVIGTIRNVNLGVSSQFHAGISQLLEISPLPFGIAAVLRALQPGLPTFYLGYSRTADMPPDNELVEPTVSLASITSDAYVGALFQDRIALVPWAWIEMIGTAMRGKDTDEGVSQWQEMLNLYDHARILRVIDHVGRPATHQPFERNVGGRGWESVPTDENGVLSLPLPSEGQVELRWNRNSSSGNISLPVHALYENLLKMPDDRQLSTPPGQSIVLPSDFTRGHLQILDVAQWLAPRAVGTSTQLAYFCTNSRLQPLVDGASTFKHMLADLQASAAPGCGAHFAGWSFNDFPLDLRHNNPSATTITEITKQILQGSGDVRFLIDKFLNFREDAPTTDNLTIQALFALLLFTGYSAHLILSTKGIVDTNLVGYFATTGFVILLQLLYDRYVAGGEILREVEQKFDTSRDIMSLLEQIENDSHKVIAIRCRHPIKLADNPLNEITPPFWIPLPFEISDYIEHVGSWHQKIQIIKRLANDGSRQFVGYVGGVDINLNRLDSPGHLGKKYATPETISAAPLFNAYHDVHARLTGPVVADVALTFQERYAFENDERTRLHQEALPAPAFNPPVWEELQEQTARHIVQIGRTYFKPRQSSGSVGLPFAPNGETTTYDTLTRAIQSAQEYIYIEDQFFTPNDEYTRFLLDAASSCKRLIIIVPIMTDQIFGDIRRKVLFNQLRQGWGDRILIGTPMRRPVLADAGRVASKGRCNLLARLAQNEDTILLGPAARLPSDVPFWLWVEGELMLAIEIQNSDNGQYKVLRCNSSDPLWRASVRSHAIGAPVTLAQLKGIYVHSKIMMVDDVFVGIGSTNLNRRGFFHDGEIHAFAIPEQLKAAPENPALALRTALWAEHLGIAPSMGRALLSDPIAAVDLFRRSIYSGNRFLPLDALVPKSGTIPFPGEKSTLHKIFAVLGEVELESMICSLWNRVSDPTSEADMHPDLFHQDFPPDIE